MKKLSFLFAFMLVLFTGSMAFAVVDIEGRYWFTDLDGTVKVTEGGTSGTEIDLTDDLGVEDDDFLDARITLELGSHKIRYGYMPLKWNGSKTTTQNIVFNGETYSASTDVQSELKMGYHRLGYEYDFIDTLNNRLGVIFEIKYFDGEASLTAPSAGLDETESFKAPIPTVGIAAQVGLPFLLSVGGEVTGMGIGSEAYIIDGEAMVNLKPAPFVVISGGYRIFKLHLESDDDLADLTVKGPFVMLRADF
ncbi:MAG TPA: hypothetical protein DDW94_01095 [Deltaproteobacteria bacterium]|nr:MAG: hypothetical protein A2Z79_06460 [Deltaproteobacteria bacterium GWA2_55_82]OGQ63409.1 MAG: hypothetical protein A3I81_03455 [Deltaproteobacteria bacterium RIFCSPLOWO2_02_FULL_55_12]OIJ73177.1 MAG: hypothetical protein A2V21_302200 [Deltaproteobacteria bacterium GWC2_55_46]HBG45567.1 hypothetical protein [Deltaproteobacteria bacterium]HCY10398.1 hypothetical protein [Deltaproteobacteria bacterium]